MIGDRGWDGMGFIMTGDGRWKKFQNYLTRLL